MTDSEEDLQPTKKEQILSLYEGGTTDIAEIVRQVKARPSYVATVLQKAGHLSGDRFALYVVTTAEADVYSRYFRPVPSYKDVDAARESCALLSRLYDYFERLGDRAGQHHAALHALTARNRARWSGKTEESEVFHQWLMTH